MTAELLGFNRPMANAMDAVSDRDFVAESLFALALLGVHLSRIGEEMILWSTAEFGFVGLDEATKGAINAFLEDPLGCLRRFWDEKKRSPMLLLALASKLMADNLRRKRLKREAAAAPAATAAKPAAPGRKKRK